MNTENFNKLLDGDPAKWSKEIYKPLFLNQESLSKQQIKDKIQETQVDIPEEKRKEIHDFTQKLRALGVKERTIRQRVKVRFNITVV